MTNANPTRAQKLARISSAKSRHKAVPAFAARVESLEAQIRTAAAMLAKIRGPAYAWRHCYVVADEVVEKAKRDGLL